MRLIFTLIQVCQRMQHIAEHKLLPQVSLTPGGPRPALAALVVTFNRLDKLQETVAALLASPADELDYLVVVDNASTDGTGAWLASLEDPRLRVITMARNTGGAGGFNHGLREITETFDPDWIVVMDDDGRPDPGALSAFRARYAKADCEAVAAAVRYPDGRICDMNRPSYNPFSDWRVFLKTVRNGRSGFHLDTADYDAAPKRVDVGSFVGLFLSRRAIKMCGYPDASFFIYAEDVLFTLGLTQAGGRIMFDPDIRFSHDMTTLDTGQDRRIKPMWKAYFYYRNLLTLYRVASGWMFWLLFPIVLFSWRRKAAIYGQDKMLFTKLLRLAVADGLRGRRDKGLEDILTICDGRG